jgi:hypothetical protein
MPIKPQDTFSFIRRAIIRRKKDRGGEKNQKTRVGKDVGKLEPFCI